MSETFPRPYPSRLPFTPPEDGSSRAVRLPRWALPLAGGSAGVLLLALVVCAFLVARSGRQRDAAHAALDGAIAAQLYQAYLNLNLLADAAENGIYSEADRTDLLRTVLGLLDSVDAQLGPKAGNRESLERCRQLSKLLRAQAAELRAYWRTEDPAYARKFQQLRAQAWTRITELVEVQP